MDISVILIPEIGYITQNGNHRLGILTKKYESVTKIKVLHVEDEYNGPRNFWEEMVAETQKENIYNYEDFWKFAIANFGE